MTLALIEIGVPSVPSLIKRKSSAHNFIKCVHWKDSDSIRLLQLGTPGGEAQAFDNNDHTLASTPKMRRGSWEFSE